MCTLASDFQLDTNFGVVKKSNSVQFALTFAVFKLVKSVARMPNLCILVKTFDMKALIFFIRILPLFILLSCNSNSIENSHLVKTVAIRSDGGSLYEMNLDSSKDIMTFEEAQEYAASYGDGWRLPTVMELITLRYKGGNQYFDISTYWSSDVLNDDVIGVYNFYIDKSDYELASGRNYVMLIRKVE